MKTQLWKMPLEVMKNIPLYKQECQTDTEHFQRCVDKDYDSKRREKLLKKISYFIVVIFFLWPKSDSDKNCTPYVHVENNIKNSIARVISHQCTELDSIKEDAKKLYEKIDNMIFKYEKPNNKKRGK